MQETVKVAGGLVIRRTETGLDALIIDDRFGYVTLPKGHVEPGEILEETALREIEEETGIACRLLAPLQKVTYAFREGKTGEQQMKDAYYYLAEAIGGTLKAQEEEISAVRFVPLAEALRLVEANGYPNNREVFAKGLALAEAFANGKWKDITGLIDHTLLKPDATPADVLQICKEARAYQFASVCVQPSFVSQCVQALAGTPVKVCTVIGFPHGATTTTAKAAEAREAAASGAVELDMVLAIGRVIAGDWAYVQRDIEAVVSAAGTQALVKVILETGLLTPDQQAQAARVAKRAGAHFVKTSTGYAGQGATVEAVRILRNSVGTEVGVKASGGIRTRADALAMVQAGASRIGASAGAKLLSEGAQAPF